MSKQTEEEQKLLRKEMPEVERLTDLIFGLALSIGALVLISQPPQDSVGILADVVIFSYSFFILVTVWTHYTVTLTYIRIETLSILRLNFILLFLVALEPYFFFLLTSGPKEFIGGAIDDIASMLYAIDLAALMAILAYFSDLVIKKEGRKIHKEEVTRHDVDRIVYYASAVMLVLSALPIFWTTNLSGYPLRYYLWIGPVVAIVMGSMITAYQSRMRSKGS